MINDVTVHSFRDNTILMYFLMLAAVINLENYMKFFQWSVIVVLKVIADCKIIVLDPFKFFYWFV